ncbi:glucose-6-phosphate exchanger SLC37A2 [Lepeophtheirus salmonis]|nr:glucose-6-phosphate exchanger SLC37A2-like [Lepeophtheirus salmonis]XP_040575846.1 glucose-6-phosphate exchanger SLC37A2-like [Lepeophtheirus salmonis]XP_040575847.1 glucose-6-phosphate exchanger SLC37A2-like [Lepeophtheirus salmonis]XP_040575848.1 glucose-6-phosphate exchanger SLC37A2-like [Lepeophtheirus salmonis]
MRKSLPWGMSLLDLFCPVTQERKLVTYRFFILFLTFSTYVCFHMSRKPISVVKPVLANCTRDPVTGGILPNGTCTSDFITQFNGKGEDILWLEGILDGIYLMSYAGFMFISGILAERINLRYFLALGAIFSGLFTYAFGVGRYWGFKSFYYYAFVQFLGGAFQSTGWPGVVTVVANWFGKAKKGLIFGIWNSHTSIGNILGSTIAAAFVNDNWGLSFIVPGMIIAGMGFLLWLFLVPHPADVYLDVDIQESSQLQDSTHDTYSPVEKESSPLLDDDYYGPRERRGLGYQSVDSSPTTERNEHAMLAPVETEEKPIGFLDAVKIPGVIEFSLCLFFAKLVSYTFLYWLPTFIKDNGHNIKTDTAALLSTLFDVGGIFGGVIAGLASDYSGKSATTCAVMLVFAIPVMLTYEAFGSQCHLDMNKNDHCYTGNISLLILVGLLVNGPYALITTAVSAQLGRHPSIGHNSMALATVTSIIDGTGSVGAAVGPLLAGTIHGIKNTFWMLVIADILALVLLSRLVVNDIKIWREDTRRSQSENMLND